MNELLLKTRARQPIYDILGQIVTSDFSIGWCRLYKLENNAIISVTREGQYYIDICLGMIISSIDRSCLLYASAGQCYKTEGTYEIVQH